MSGYPLKAVLDLRRREEEAAAARLADATRERATAEAEEARRIADVAAARARWDEARGKGLGDSQPRDAGAGRAGRGDLVPAVMGATAANRSRFVARRRDELGQVQAALGAFRSGSLARAREAEVTARGVHLAARLGREAFDKHEAKFRAGARKTAERREEETLEEVARAARHPRGDRRS